MKKQLNIFTSSNHSNNVDNSEINNIEHVNNNKNLFNNLKTYNPLWLSVSEAAKMGGVQNKTIRRAIQSNSVKFKIIKNRYLIELTSLIIFLHTKTKLKNKLNQFGVGQYIKEWK
jgi:hypothetical protein